MYGRERKPPMRGLFIRLGAAGGLVFGLANGVIGHVNRALNCSSDGTCSPREESVGAADILLPIGLGVLGGIALGLLAWMFVNWLTATR